MVGCAAADGEHPEEGGAEGEGDRRPDQTQEGGLERGLDTVKLGRALNGADHHHRHGSRQACGGNGSDDGDARDEEDDAREAARALGEEAKEELDAERDEGDNVGYLGPLRRVLEGVKAFLHLGGDLDVLAGGDSQVLDHARVKSVRRPVKLRLLALLLLGLQVLGAVSPQVDCVDVGEAEVRSCDVARLSIAVDYVVGGFDSIAIGNVVDDALGIVQDVALDNGLDGYRVDFETGHVHLEHVEIFVRDAAKTRYQ